VEEAWDGRSDYAALVELTAGGELELNIKEKVYCEIWASVVQEKASLPAHWGVQFTLDLQVDETGALNPGVSFITPMHAGITNFVGEFLAPSGSLLQTVTYPFVSTPQSYNLGIGGTLSSQATREDKFQSYWDLDKLVRGNTQCPSTYRSGSSPLLTNDLGIRTWLHDALFAQRLYPSSRLSPDSDTVYKQDILSYHVRFLVITSGNGTPTWKLVRIATGNGNLPLASINRTRAHDLLITFGPSYKAGKEPSTPSLMAANSHLAQEIGIAISNSTKAIVPNP
jgi:hypothetical protein